jgi:hypothetical protein
MGNREGNKDIRTSVKVDKMAYGVKEYQVNWIYVLHIPGGILQSVRLRTIM